MTPIISIRCCQIRFNLLPICPSLLATSCALFVLSTTMSRAGGEGIQTAAFHYRLDHHSENPHCVATRLLPKTTERVSSEQKPDELSRQVVHALTAAHCFRRTVEAIHIGCSDSSTSEALITAFHWHPTHDAVLMELLIQGKCLGKGVAIRQGEFDNGPDNQQLEIPVAVRPKSMTVASVAVQQIRPGNKPSRVADVLSIDQETLRLSDQTVCLKAGDSGYPLLLDGEIAGMLISGLEGCPTEQTGLRIDRIAGWISGHMEE